MNDMYDDNEIRENAENLSSHKREQILQKILHSVDVWKENQKFEHWIKRRVESKIKNKLEDIHRKKKRQVTPSEERAIIEEELRKVHLSK